MWVRVLVSLALLISASQPAQAETRIYDISGDFSTLFPTDGSLHRPNPVTGLAIIEHGPRLTELTLFASFFDIVGSTATSGIPGTTTSIDFQVDIRPDLSPPQLGTGTVETAIAWSPISDWTQTGRFVCITHCPGGCPTGVSMCLPFVGFEGTGPIPPIKSTTFDTDTWSFTGDGSGGGFEAPSFEFVNLAGGLVTMSLLPRGILRPVVPAAPLAGVAALGGVLVYLAARAIRRRR
jgi:hypothetical protein